MTHGQLSNVLNIGGDPHSSGPWSDIAHGLLWVLDKQTRKSVNFDGTTWAAVNEPLISYDVGVWANGNRSEFWLVYGLQGVFLWDQSQSRWAEVKRPKRDASVYEPYGVVGVLPIGSAPTFIVRHGPCETVTANTNGKAVFSISSKGIYEFDGFWKKLAAYPPEDRGPHSEVFLAANGEQVAYATSDGRSFSRVWTTENGRFRLLDFMK